MKEKVSRAQAKVVLDRADNFIKLKNNKNYNWDGPLKEPAAVRQARRRQAAAHKIVTRFERRQMEAKNRVTAAFDKIRDQIRFELLAKHDLQKSLKLLDKLEAMKGR